MKAASAVPRSSDPLTNELVALLLSSSSSSSSSTSPDASTSALTTFLSTTSSSTWDYPHLLTFTLTSLPCLSPTHLHLLHLHHLVRFECLLHHCPPSSPHSSHLTSLLLAAHSLQPDASLSSSFASSSLSSLLLLLFHLSSLSSPTPLSSSPSPSPFPPLFPLYPLASSSSTSLLLSLFFQPSSSPHSQSLRQRILVLSSLLRPPSTRLLTLGHWLTRCLQPPPSPTPPSLPADTAAAALSPAVPITAPHLSAVFFYLLSHIDPAAVLPLYTAAFGGLGEADSSPAPPTCTLPSPPSSSPPSSSSSSLTPVSLLAHRCFLTQLLGPARYQRSIALHLFTFFSSLLIRAAHHRDATAATTALRLGRHAALLQPPSPPSSNSLFPLPLPPSSSSSSSPSPCLPRDYSDWIDGVIARLLHDSDVDPTPQHSPIKAGKKRRAARRERFVPKKKPTTPPLPPSSSFDPRLQTSSGRRAGRGEPGEQVADVDAEVLMDMDPAWLEGEGITTAAVLPPHPPPMNPDDEEGEVDAPAPPKKRRKARREEGGGGKDRVGEGGVDVEMDVRAAAAVEGRRRERRRALLLFVLGVMRGMVEEDEGDVLVHHVRMVKGWKGGEGEEDAGLTEAEVDGFVMVARRRINRLAGQGGGEEGGGGQGGTSREPLLLIDSQ